MIHFATNATSTNQNLKHQPKICIKSIHCLHTLAYIHIICNLIEVFYESLFLIQVC